MKVLQSFIMRAVIAMVVGVLLIKFREESLMYILSSILIIGAVNQFINLGMASKDGKIGFGWWIIPTLILATGIFVIAKRIDPVTTELFVVGWCMLLYAVMECAIALKIRQIERKKAKEEAERIALEEAERSAEAPMEEEQPQAQTEQPTAQEEERPASQPYEHSTMSY